MQPVLLCPVRSCPSQSSEQFRRKGRLCFQPNRHRVNAETPSSHKLQLPPELRGVLILLTKKRAITAWSELCARRTQRKCTTCWDPRRGGLIQMFMTWDPPGSRTNMVTPGLILKQFMLMLTSNSVWRLVMLISCGLELPPLLARGRKKRGWGWCSNTGKNSTKDAPIMKAHYTCLMILQILRYISYISRVPSQENKAPHPPPPPDHTEASLLECSSLVLVHAFLLCVL